MTYDFKFVQEMLWIAFVAAGMQLLMVLSGFNPEGITDWKGWAIAIGTGCLRAAAAAVIAAVTARRDEGE